MAAATIVDQFGRPYSQPPAPIEDVAASVGIAHPATAWAPVAATLTPARAAVVLRDARQGNALQYLTLAEELEERDLHYSGVLQTRKLAATAEDPEILPGDDTPLAQRIADDFRESVAEQPHFTEMLFDLMDALAKGYSVIQPLWETSERQWSYRGFEWHDPRLFMFDPSTLRELRLRSANTGEGVPLPPGQFFVHYPKIKTGIRLRGGLALLATVAHIAKSYTLMDWLAFCEVYGMPLRIAKYDPNTMGTEEINRLKIAVANVGHDAAAIVPHGAEIQILDARRPNANGKNVFEGLANYWDAQVSKALLGQTMTTDDGSSKAQAEVHEGVAVKYTKADVRSLCATSRANVIRPWTVFNYGPAAPVPRMAIPCGPPEDVRTFTEAALPWVERGKLEVRASEIYEKLGLTAPNSVGEDATLGGAQEVDAQQLEREFNQPVPAVVE